MKVIKYTLLASVMALCVISSTAFATNAQMNVTLARINRILNQINPLVNLAEQQQNPNARVKFQFSALRADIVRIQAGIAEATNRVSIQPRVVKPLSGDYLPVRESVLKNEKPISSEDRTR